MSTSLSAILTLPVAHPCDGESCEVEERPSLSYQKVQLGDEGSICSRVSRERS